MNDKISEIILLSSPSVQLFYRKRVELFNLFDISFDHFLLEDIINKHNYYRDILVGTFRLKPTRYNYYYKPINKQFHINEDYNPYTNIFRFYIYEDVVILGNQYNVTIGRDVDRLETRTIINMVIGSIPIFDKLTSKQILNFYHWCIENNINRHSMKDIL